MSEHLPVISGKVFIKFLEKIGFTLVRINGSHHRLRHPDGRVTTVPVHRNMDLPKGLLRKIIREDLKMDNEDFQKLFIQFGR
ncbi:MAG: addiction module toxin, HicA family [Bacteroidia bacterium]|jgi:predicted RNA binding protein YcfA (HicA-like mRNA interferase family)|nr:addiction module toxin, HicA family [Bacteroidia bacterium]